MRRIITALTDFALRALLHTFPSFLSSEPRPIPVHVTARIRTLTRRMAIERASREINRR